MKKMSHILSGGGGGEGKGEGKGEAGEGEEEGDEDCEAETEVEKNFNDLFGLPEEKVLHRKFTNPPLIFPRIFLFS